MFKSFHITSSNLMELLVVPSFSDISEIIIITQSSLQLRLSMWEFTHVLTRFLTEFKFNEPRMFYFSYSNCGNKI